MTAHEGAEPHACCAPARDEQPAPQPAPSPRRQKRNGFGSMRLLPAGSFLMGGADPDANPQDGEGPVREVRLSAYRIDTVTVSNARFATFVKDTGYVTEAEHFGWSFVFHLLLSPEQRRALPQAAAATPWWLPVSGAFWKQPEGPGSGIGDRQNHPVVHVSYADALAFCAWSGTRLPTEAEWEHAARGGLVQARYAWGEELTPRGRHRCNIWQGRFPEVNTLEDGYLGTAPVNSFAPNGYGLHNVAGNVWEWCADWFSPTFHADGPREDPAGPPEGEARVMRGGSFLCHDSYCNRYRVAARSSNTPESSASNLGFRVAANPG